MIPVGFHARIHARSRVHGWISEYTRASRTRRAMSCVNCEPQSRIRMRLVPASVTLPVALPVVVSAPLMRSSTRVR